MKEEWQAIRSWADDRNFVIKKDDKGSSVIVWHRIDHVKNREKTFR